MTPPYLINPKLDYGCSYNHLDSQIKCEHSSLRQVLKKYQNITNDVVKNIDCKSHKPMKMKFHEEPFQTSIEKMLKNLQSIIICADIVEFSGELTASISAIFENEFENTYFNKCTNKSVSDFELDYLERFDQSQWNWDQHWYAPWANIGIIPILDSNFDSKIDEDYWGEEDKLKTIINPFQRWLKIKFETLLPELKN